MSSSVRLPDGPRAYRTRIRTLGPVYALLVPALLGVCGLLLLRSSQSAMRGVLGFAACVLAAPALIAFGVPLTAGSDAYRPAILASAVLWLVVGLIAARRATRRPAAMWGDFWREFAWFAAAIWLGVVVALVAANLILGQTLL